MRFKQMAGFALPVLLISGAMQVSAQADWGVVNTIHVGGDGAWDYVAVDPATHRVFVTRATHTQAIDGATGKVLGDIPGQVRSHGTALVPVLNRGFITDGGGSGAIVVFNLATYAVLGMLATMPDSDGIIYDRAMNLVLAVSGDGAKLMTLKPDIDPSERQNRFAHRPGRRAGVSGGGR
jgi:DNA-binding beta-propeller fold protein YncE